jgi:hypothetical protein
MARLAPQFNQPDELSVEDISAIVALGREQAALMDQLQDALETGDEAQALAAARDLVGLEKRAREQ